MPAQVVVHGLKSIGNIGFGLFRDSIGVVLKREGKKQAAITVILVSDAAIRRLNKEFLRHDYATDILTFPLDDSGIEAEFYISVDTARLQAREYRVSIREELARLAIHGTLHLCGYDDATEILRNEMKIKEDRYLAEYLRKHRKKA